MSSNTFLQLSSFIAFSGFTPVSSIYWHSLLLWMYNISLPVSVGHLYSCGCVASNFISLGLCLGLMCRSYSHFGLPFENVFTVSQSSCDIPHPQQVRAVISLYPSQPLLAASPGGYKADFQFSSGVQRYSASFHVFHPFFIFTRETCVQILVYLKVWASVMSGQAQTLLVLWSLRVKHNFVHIFLLWLPCSQCSDGPISGHKGSPFSFKGFVVSALRSCAAFLLLSFLHVQSETELFCLKMVVPCPDIISFKESSSSVDFSLHPNL